MLAHRDPAGCEHRALCEYGPACLPCVSCVSAAPPPPRILPEGSPTDQDPPSPFHQGRPHGEPLGSLQQKRRSDSCEQASCILGYNRCPPPPPPPYTLRNQLPGGGRHFASVGHFGCLGHFSAEGWSVMGGVRASWTSEQGVQWEGWAPREEHANQSGVGG